MNLIHPYFFAECRIFVLTSKLTLDLVPSFPIHGPGGLQHCPVDFPEHESRVGKKRTLNLLVNGHFVQLLSHEAKAGDTCRFEIQLSRRELIFHLRVPHVCPGLANVGPARSHEPLPRGNGAVSTPGDVDGPHFSQKTREMGHPESFNPATSMKHPGRGSPATLAPQDLRPWKPTLAKTQGWATTF